MLKNQYTVAGINLPEIQPLVYRLAIFKTGQIYEVSHKAKPA
jgi:hypothetical protein